jgi:hypothetical protein
MHIVIVEFYKNFKETSFNKRDWLTWSNVVIKIMEISEKKLMSF